MSSTKNKIVVMGLTLLLLMMLPLGVLAGENLISNGDSSRLDDSGLPVGYRQVLRPGTARKRFRRYWTEAGEDGGTVVRLENFSENDARLEQQVAVKGNSLYHISARVKAEGGDPRFYRREHLRQRHVGGFRRLDGYRRAVGNRRALRQDGLLREQHGCGAARGLLRAGKPGLRVV